MNPTLHRVALSLILLAPLAGGLLSQGRWQEIPVFESRQGMQMAYDSAHQKIFGFGGGFSLHVEFPNNIWEWEGTRWKARQTSTRPRSRGGPGFEYSGRHQGLLLYGGHTTTRQAVLRKSFVNDTWLWDGRRWTQLKPKISPKPDRESVAMAYDPGRKRMVIFGGNISLMVHNPIDETWEYDGKTWKQLFPRNKPSKRSRAAMAYDPKSGRILLYGGLDRQLQTEGDTWAWDGKDWTKLAGVVPGLRTRTGSKMLAIPWKNTMYLVGGLEAVSGKPGQYAPKTDMWEWTGKTWKQIPGSHVPVSALRNDAVADPVTKKIITTGGDRAKLTNNDQNDTWSWDGKTWTRISEGTKLERLHRQVSYALDPRRDQIMALVAPETGQPSKYPLETWVLRPAGQWTRLKTKHSPPGFASTYEAFFPRMAWHDDLGLMLMCMKTPAGYQTWIWNGSDWTKDQSKLQPETTLLCYDSQRKTIISMEYDPLRRARNMWSWNSGGWSKTHVAIRGPSLFVGRDGWAYDPLRDRIVAFYAGANGKKFMTAEWDGKQWTIGERGGGKIRNAQLFFHPGLGGVVACGGLDLSVWWRTILPNQDSWLWDGKTWKKLVGPKLPKQRNLAMMQAFYDPGRQRGIAVFPFPVPSQLWEFRLDSIRASQAYPRPGEAFSMDVNMPKQAGNPFVLMFALGTRPGIPLRKVKGVGVELLPLTPDPVFLLSLQLGLIAGLDSKGKASIPLRFPNDPRLLWLDLHMAGVIFDKTGIAAISDQVPIRIVK